MKKFLEALAELNAKFADADDKTAFVEEYDSLVASYSEDIADVDAAALMESVEETVSEDLFSVLLEAKKKDDSEDDSDPKDDDEKDPKDEAMDEPEDDDMDDDSDEKDKEKQKKEACKKKPKKEALDIEVKAESVNKDSIATMLETLDVSEEDASEFSAVLKVEVARLAKEVASEIVAETIATETDRLTAEFADKEKALEAKVESYIEKASAEFFEENKVDIVNSETLAKYKEFTENVSNLMAKFNISVDDSENSIVESLKSELAEYKESVDKLTDEKLELKNTILLSKVETIKESACAGLSECSQDKLREMLEEVDFKDADDFEKKAIKIRKTFFKESAKDETDELISNIVESVKDVANDVVDKRLGIDDAITEALSQ